MTIPFGTSASLAGLLENRPDPDIHVIGRFYLATDIGVLFRDNGTEWQAAPLTDLTYLVTANNSLSIGADNAIDASSINSLAQGEDNIIIGQTIYAVGIDPATGTISLEEDNTDPQVGDIIFLVNLSPRAITLPLTVSDRPDTLTVIVEESFTFTGSDAHIAFVRRQSNLTTQGNTRVSGTNNTARGTANSIDGTANSVTGNNSHAEGASNTITGDAAHAEGESNTATANYTHAEGHATSATAPAAHAEGSNTLAAGYNAHAEGSLTQATAPQAHAEGEGSEATSNNSHAGGRYSKTRYASQVARALGKQSASGDQQYSQFYSAIVTANATPTYLIDLPPLEVGRAMSVVVNIVAKKQNAAAAASFLRRLLISRVSNTTAIIGAVQTIGTDIIDAALAGLAVNIVANDTTDAIQINVTGLDATNILWHAVLDASEVIY
jgi:hypothetical protein